LRYGGEDLEALDSNLGSVLTSQFVPRLRYVNLCDE